ncbi:MAG: hypothetical protein OEY00_12650, partial [Gammaproteobacteria bacterium]|nr:hypothetical protein [Gammaproteobacteria bacterium]
MSKSIYLVAVLICSMLLSSCTGPQKFRQAKSYHYGMHCYQHKVRYDDKLKKPAWALIKQYSPEGTFMIEQHRKQTRKVCNAETEHFASFINTKEKQDDLNYLISITTSVHEMAHNFTSMMPASKAFKIIPKGKYHWVYLNSPYGELAYYLPGKGTVYVPTTPTWPARKMDSDIPTELKDFTYQQYIAGQHGSNVIGVYALLDEFHAYFHDHQMSERMMRSKQVEFFEPGDYLNFLYFKYYILAYLDYGRRHHSGMY